MDWVETGWTEPHFRGPDRPIDENPHLAKVRVAGSNPVFRSLCAFREQEGRGRLRCPQPGHDCSPGRHIWTVRAKGICGQLGATRIAATLPHTGTTGTGKPACSARYLGRVAPLGWGNLGAALLDPFEQGAGVAFDLVVAARNRDG